MRSTKDGPPSPITLPKPRLLSAAKDTPPASAAPAAALGEGLACAWLTAAASIRCRTRAYQYLITVISTNRAAGITRYLPDELAARGRRLVGHVLRRRDLDLTGPVGLRPALQHG